MTIFGHKSLREEAGGDGGVMVMSGVVGFAGGLRE